MPIEALLAILTSAGVILRIVGADRAVRHDRTALDKRVRRYGGRAYQMTDEEQKQAASAAVTQLLAKRVEASISGRTFAAALQTDLARANLTLTGGEFLIIQVAAAAVIGMLAWLISGALFVGSIFGAMGWFIPKIWLGRRQAGRLKSFNNQLGDTISLMSNSLRSGLSLVQSMEMISREAEAPIAEEFERAARAIGLGGGRQEARSHAGGRGAGADRRLRALPVRVRPRLRAHRYTPLGTRSRTGRGRWGWRRHSANVWCGPSSGSWQMRWGASSSRARRIPRKVRSKASRQSRPSWPWRAIHSAGRRLTTWV